MQSDATQSKAVKLAALKFRSISWLDRRWLFGRLSPSEKDSLILALRDLKKHGIKKADFASVQELINHVHEDSSLEALPARDADDLARYLPECFAQVIAGGGNSDDIQARPTEYARSALIDACLEFRAGEKECLP